MLLMMMIRRIGGGWWTLDRRESCMKEKEDESGIDGLEQGECLLMRGTAAPVNVDRYMAYSRYFTGHALCSWYAGAPLQK